MGFANAYEDDRRAAAYDQLEFGGTYILAFRALDELLDAHVTGRHALDFGCGTGRTSRLLRRVGFETIGVDIAREMVDVARRNDATGDYRVIEDGDFSSLRAESFDLVLSAFTFDNIAGRTHRRSLLGGLAGLLAPRGRMVNIVSTPEIYTNEWVTFTTRAFPENHEARAGDIVRIVTTDYDDVRPVEDILWSDREYRRDYEAAGLRVLDVRHPLARGDEGIDWLSETRLAPWALYVLARA